MSVVKNGNTYNPISEDHLIPVLLLAAGGSLRMGQAKQLLPWGNKTLLEHQIERLLKTGKNVNVVLGAHAKQIIPVIEKYQLGIFMNEEWESGMGSSVSYGVSCLIKKYPTAEGVLIALADQPLVTSGHFIKLLQTFRSGGQQIIASEYRCGKCGVPAVFDRVYFNILTKLNGEEGARRIIAQHQNAVQGVFAREMLDDLDTYETYKNMLKKYLAEWR